MANLWRNWNPCVLLVGMQNGEAAMENSVLKTLKIELPYDPAMPLLDIYPKEWKSGSQRDVSTPMLSDITVFLSIFLFSPSVKLSNLCKHCTLHIQANKDS